MLKGQTYILLACLMALACAATGWAQTSAGRAQAWRIYRGESSCVELVSFPLDNPRRISVDATLPNHTLLGAVRGRDAYYMIDSDEGGIPARFLRYDVERGRCDTVRTYTLADNEMVFIFLDMAYDAAADATYALAFDIAAATEAPDGSIESPQGLYRVDTRTGLTSLVGLQDEVYFICIAIDGAGRMLGLSAEGRLWEIAKDSFTPVRELTDENNEQPSNLQTIAYDGASGNLYWAGFCEAEMGFLGVFTLSENPVAYSRIGLLAANSELIGMSIDTSPLPRTSPSAPKDFTAKAGAQGARTAQLAWRMPTTDLDGFLLAGPLNANVYANGELLTTIADLQPGAEASWNGESPEGMVEFSVKAANRQSSMVNGQWYEGRAVYAVSIFVGGDVPGRPEYLEAVLDETTNNITLTWEEPACGGHGGWYDAATMTYTVVRYPDAKTMAEGLRECAYTDKTISEPHAYYYHVFAQTKEGRGPAAESQTIMAGGALQLPYSCDFSSDEAVRSWTVLDADGDGYFWGHSQNYQSAQYSYMRYFPDERIAPQGEADDWLISPPLTMEAEHHYRVSYRLRTQGPLFPVTYDVTVGRSTEPKAQSLIVGETYMDTNNGSFGFEPKSHIFAAEGIAGGPAETWYVGFHMRNRVSMHISDVKIEEVFAQDIALESIACAEICRVGESEDFVFMVRNNGFDDIESYRLVLTDGSGNVLTTKDVGTGLAVGEMRTDTLRWTCTEAKDMLISGRAEVLGDTNMDNNVAERIATFSNTSAWYDFTQGYSYTSTSPFCLEKAHGFSQSIYTREWLDAPKGVISEIRYYFKTDYDRTVTPFHVRLLLANTTQEGYEFRNALPIDEELLQEVFDGEVTLTGKEGYIAIPFDTPFAYDGEGLAVTVYSSSDMTGEYIKWICYYRGSDDIMHTLYQSGAREFVYTGTVNASPELPHASFLWTESTGINTVNNGQWSTVNGQWSMVNKAYDLQGRRILRQPKRGVYIRKGQKILN